MTDSTNTTRIAIRLPTAMRATLDAAATTQGVSLSDVIRALLATGLGIACAPSRARAARRK